MEEEQAKTGGLREQEPARSWPPLQGQYNEGLMRLLLRQAGAGVIDPPDHLSDEFAPFDQPHKLFGRAPRIDGLIRWPEMGVDEWCVLELKFLRTYAHLPIALEGLFSERTYWFQSVAYANTANQAIANARAWAEAEDEWSTGIVGLQNCEEWRRLGDVDVSKIFFMSTAKDPSTTRMLFRNQIGYAKYEDHPEKMTAANRTSLATKQAKRDRYVEIGGSTDFYFELLDRNDVDAIDTWAQIQAVPEVLAQPGRPEPAHDSMVPDDQLDDECHYCDQIKECREIQGERQVLSFLDLNKRADKAMDEEMRF